MIQKYEKGQIIPKHESSENSLKMYENCCFCIISTPCEVIQSKEHSSSRLNIFHWFLSSMEWMLLRFHSYKFETLGFKLHFGTVNSQAYIDQVNFSSFDLLFY